MTAKPSRPKTGAIRIPTKAEIDEFERLHAALIAEGKFLADVPAHDVCRMIRKGLLTAEAAAKAGYWL